MRTYSSVSDTDQTRNTLKDDTCSIEERTSFKESLAEADMAELSVIDGQLTLLTIEKTNNNYICLKCSTKNEFVVSDRARCSNCKGLNKLKTVPAIFI